MATAFKETVKRGQEEKRSYEDGNRGEKGSYENRKLGRWEKKREIPNEKYQNTDYSDNKKT